MNAIPGILGYPLMGASTVVITRMLQQWFPTPLETAQLKSIHENLDLANRRLESEERRAAEDLKQRREALQLQLEAAERGQIDSVERQNWPLETSAASIVRCSQSLGGHALNLLLKRSFWSAEDQTTVEVRQLLAAFEKASGKLVEEIPQYLGRDVTFYKETVITPGRKVTLLGQQLVSTLHSLTSTEPTALIEVVVEGPSQLGFRVACWGWAGDASAPHVDAKSKASVTVPNGEEAAVDYIARALLVLAAALSDQFQALRTLAKPRPLATYQVLRIAGDVRFVGESSRGDAPATQSARDLLLATRDATIQSIEKAAPVLAAEAGARSALDALEAGDRSRAEHELDAALEVYRGGAVKKSKEETKLMRRLLTPAASGEAPLIQQAVNKVRGLDFTDFPEATSRMSADEVMSRLGEFDGVLTEEQRRKIRHKLTEMFSYQPTIGVLGKCGAGKSSLCNALFGEDVCEVSDVEACTRKPQEVLLDIGQGKKVTLIDLPGVGEAEDRDAEYAKLYRSLLPKLDAVLWIVKADDRALSVDQTFHQRIVGPQIRAGTPLLAVVTQSEKMQPTKQWDYANGLPGPEQKQNLNTKVGILADLFGIRREQVVAVSAEERYGLATLVDKLILLLPDSKKLVMVTAVDPEHVSERAQADVQEGVTRELTRAGLGAAIGTGLGGLLGTVGGPAGMAVGAAIGAAVGGWVGSLFKRRG